MATKAFQSVLLSKTTASKPSGSLTHVKHTEEKINLTLNKGNFNFMQVAWGHDLMHDLQI